MKANKVKSYCVGFRLGIFDFRLNYMKAICPECKNDVDLSRYPMMKEGIIIECNICGITLLVRRIEGDKIETEIVDEGK